ncbi:hypothetical protein CEXT_157151 [Caerostris extrusa]|uniref:Uncharacterized protein n=1 Tax=Caerostris extrusa TaxID=172846 RepID=A0AAV4XX69_CAEEX|nr:hypothetical protein CEXT_157151 [Caerostris extrusa]
MSSPPNTTTGTSENTIFCEKRTKLGPLEKKQIVSAGESSAASISNVSGVCTNSHVEKARGIVLPYEYLFMSYSKYFSKVRFFGFWST